MLLHLYVFNACKTLKSNENYNNNHIIGSFNDRNLTTLTKVVNSLAERFIQLEKYSTIYTFLMNLCSEIEIHVKKYQITIKNNKSFCSSSLKEQSGPIINPQVFDLGQPVFNSILKSLSWKDIGNFALSSKFFYKATFDFHSGFFSDENFCENPTISYYENKQFSCDQLGDKVISALTNLPKRVKTSEYFFKFCKVSKYFNGVKNYQLKDGKKIVVKWDYNRDFYDKSNSEGSLFFELEKKKQDLVIEYLCLEFGLTFSQCNFIKEKCSDLTEHWKNFSFMKDREFYGMQIIMDLLDSNYTKKLTNPVILLVFIFYLAPSADASIIFDSFIGKKCDLKCSDKGMSRRVIFFINYFLRLLSLIDYKEEKDLIDECLAFLKMLASSTTGSLSQALTASHDPKLNFLLFTSTVLDDLFSRKQLKLLIIFGKEIIPILRTLKNEDESKFEIEKKDPDEKGNCLLSLLIALWYPYKDATFLYEMKKIIYNYICQYCFDDVYLEYFNKAGGMPLVHQDDFSEKVRAILIKMQSNCPNNFF